MDDIERSGVAVGTDGSFGSLRAVNWAAIEAQIRDVPLTLCFVSPTTPAAPARSTSPTRSARSTKPTKPARSAVPATPAALAEQAPPGTALLAATAAPGQAEAAVIAEAAAWARRAAPGLTVVETVAHGYPLTELVELGRHSDLLVIGSRCAGGVAALNLGSVSAAVAAHAAHPVAVVRGAPVSRAAPVVVGVDGSPAGDATIRFAFEAAARQRVGLLALTAAPLPVVIPSFGWSPAVHVASAEEIGREVSDEAVLPWLEKFPEVRVDRQVVFERPATALLAASAGASLVVVGSHGHGGVAGMLLGSVSQHIVRHSRCPVAVVPG